MPNGTRITSADDFDVKLKGNKGKKGVLEEMMAMHHLPIMEGRKTISKKEMKRRLREHFVVEHFKKDSEKKSEGIVEPPQVIQAGPDKDESV